MGSRVNMNRKKLPIFSENTMALYHVHIRLTDMYQWSLWRVYSAMTDFSDVPLPCDKASSHDWPSVSMSWVNHHKMTVKWKFNETGPCLILIRNAESSIILWTQILRTCDTLKGKCYSANLAQDSWMYSWYVSVMFHFCLFHRNKKNWPRCLSLLSPIWKWDWGFIINSTRYKEMKMIDRSGDQQSFILTFLICTAVYALKAQWYFAKWGFLVYIGLC